MIKLGVVFGGVSVEYDISILSAVRAIENLNKNKYKIIPIYIDKEGIWYTGNALKNIENYKDMKILKKFLKKVILTKHKNYFCLKSNNFFYKVITDIDFILPIVHGSNVEDGTLQGYLDMIGIGYAFSNLTASVLGQDKVIMKNLLKFNNINVVDYYFCYDNEFRNNEEEVISKIEKLNYPLIVKPASLGSSIGIRVVDNQAELKEAINDAFIYDDKVITEALVKNLIELNCSVLGNRDYVKVSAIDKTISNSSFLTFEEKYIGNAKKRTSNNSKGMNAACREMPAKISLEIKEKVETLAKESFKILDNSGLVRIDFLVDSQTKEVYVNEVNTIPGDLSFYLWEEVGIKFNDLLDEVITLGIKNYKKKSHKITIFENNVFENLGIKGYKGLKTTKRR